MKIVAISDNHGQDFINQIPQCDILVHCGDILPDSPWTGKMSTWLVGNKEMQDAWVEDVLLKDYIPRILERAKYFVFIAGNHDFFFEKIMKRNSEADFRSKLPANSFYLRDSFLEIEGIKIWGTPWVTNLSSWAFNGREPGLNFKYQPMPEGLDILLTHAPAYGYCDTIKEHGLTEHLGSVALKNAIYIKHPKWVFNGHIHSGEHSPQLAKANLATKFANVSLLDESYKFRYAPLEIEL